MTPAAAAIAKAAAAGTVTTVAGTVIIVAGVVYIAYQVGSIIYYNNVASQNAQSYIQMAFSFQMNHCLQNQLNQGSNLIQAQAFCNGQSSIFQANAAAEQKKSQQGVVSGMAAYCAQAAWYNVPAQALCLAAGH